MRIQTLRTLPVALGVALVASHFAGCATALHSDPFPSVVTSIGGIGLRAQGMSEEEYKRLDELSAACQRRDGESARTLSELRDDQYTAKGWIGGATGVLAAGGGIGAAVAGATDDATAAAWLGGSTALVALAGTGLALFLEPGADEIELYNRSRLDTIGSVTALNAFVSAHPKAEKWTKAERDNYHVLVGAVENACRKPIKPPEE